MAIQEQERGGRFNSFERKARRIWDPRRARTIHACAVHAFKHRFFKPTTKRANAAFSLFKIFRGLLRSFSKPDNRRNILGSAASSIFLAAARDQRPEAGTTIDVKRAHTLWPMKFVRGKGKKNDWCFRPTDWGFSDRLHWCGLKGQDFLTTMFQ